MCHAELPCLCLRPKLAFLLTEKSLPAPYGSQRAACSTHCWAEQLYHQLCTTHGDTKAFFCSLPPRQGCKWMIAQVSWLPATYQPWGGASSDRKGGAGLLVPFTFQCRCILRFLEDAEFEGENAFVLQHDSLGFLGALDQGTEVDG